MRFLQASMMLSKQLKNASHLGLIRLPIPGAQRDFLPTQGEEKVMKKLLFLLVVIFFVLGVGCYGDYGEKKASKTSDSGGSAVSLPEGSLALPEGANSEANMHNEEGISHYKEGHYDVALKHFREASAIDASTGEVHFNEAISLDKLGDHGGATEHFKVAQQKANGNTLILESKILLNHVQ